MAGTRRLPEANRLLIDALGGLEGLTHTTAECIRDVTDPDSDHYSPQVAQRFLDSIYKQLGKEDELSQGDERLALSEQELDAELRRAAMEAITRDPEFREACFQLSLRNDPRLSEVVIEQARERLELERDTARRQAEIPSAEEFRRRREEQRLAALEGCEIVEVGDPADQEEELDEIQEFDFL